MSEQRSGASGIIYNVVVSAVLTVAVGLTAWTAQTVIEQGKDLAALRTKASATEVRVDALEQHGSRSLESHVVSDDQRVSALNSQINEMKESVRILQVMPVKLEAISTRLDSLQEGQRRIESAVADHAKSAK